MNALMSRLNPLHLIEALRGPEEESIAYQTRCVALMVNQHSPRL